MSTALLERSPSSTYRAVVAKLLQHQAPYQPGQKRAFIYARCSHDPRNLGRSVERQVEDCWRDCVNAGYWVASIYVDNDRSASFAATKDREAYAEMVVAMGRGLCDVLVCWESSRATRDMRTYCDLSDLSRDLDIGWHFNGQLFDLTNDDDEFRLMLDVTLSVKEVRRLSRRVRVGHAKAARAGRPHGRCAYGYFRVYSQHSGDFISQEVDDEPRLAVDADGVPVCWYSPAEVVEYASARFAGGDSLYMIVKQFNEMCIPSPTLELARRKPLPALDPDADPDVEPKAPPVWTEQRLRDILRNSLYAGWRIHRGARVGKGLWLPIVDEALFEAVLARLADPDRKTSHSNRAAHLLSFIGTCGVCSSVIDANWKDSNNGKPKKDGTPATRYRVYDCQKGCVSIKADALDAFVEAVLVARLEDETCLDWLTRADDTAAIAAAERAEAARAKVEEWKAIAKSPDSPWSPGEITAMVADLRQEIERLDAVSTPDYVPPQMRAMVGERAAVVWESLDLVQRRTLLRKVMRVELLKATTRGRPRGQYGMDVDRVRIGWVLEEKAAEARVEAAELGGDVVPMVPRQRAAEPALALAA
ncbi:recombinase family protein [Longispora sp. NPDC051575]|uniref:recombinase family protein n=1 Tax=Longispora sp. NPDC051575 TaxID=3154943 RepID=UPI003419CBFF